MNKVWIRITVASALFVAALSAYAEVTVAQPWVRGVVKGQTATGAFMTLKSTKATSLVGASSPVAKTVEIHEMRMEGNMMKMRPIKAIDIPVDHGLELKPGGYHVMMMGLTKVLTNGETVPITLTFRNQDGSTSTVDVQAEVRSLTQSGAPTKMDMPAKH